MQDLKSGDLCIKGSDKYSDYREKLISWEEYESEIEEFSEQIGIPSNESDFINRFQTVLEKSATDCDNLFAKECKRFLAEDGGFL